MYLTYRTCIRSLSAVSTETGRLFIEASEDAGDTDILVLSAISFCCSAAAIERRNAVEAASSKLGRAGRPGRPGRPCRPCFLALWIWR